MLWEQMVAGSAVFITYQVASLLSWMVVEDKTPSDSLNVDMRGRGIARSLAIVTGTDIKTPSTLRRRNLKTEVSL